jgi:hypothetical protein
MSKETYKCQKRPAYRVKESYNNPQRALLSLAYLSRVKETYYNRKKGLIQP